MVLFYSFSFYPTKFYFPTFRICIRNILLCDAHVHPFSVIYRCWILCYKIVFSLTTTFQFLCFLLKLCIYVTLEDNNTKIRNRYKIRKNCIKTCIYVMHISFFKPLSLLLLHVRPLVVQIQWHNPTLNRRQDLELKFTHTNPITSCNCSSYWPPIETLSLLRVF